MLMSSNHEGVNLPSDQYANTNPVPIIVKKKSSDEPTGAHNVDIPVHMIRPWADIRRGPFSQSSTMLI